MRGLGTSLQLQLIRIGLIGALLLHLATAAAADRPAAPERDAFLDRLAGDWALIGHVRDNAVRYRGRAEWVLEDGWLRLSLVDAAGPPGYAAHVYLSFDPKAGDYIAHWLDRFGAAGARVVGQYWPSGGSDARACFPVRRIDFSRHAGDCGRWRLGLAAARIEERRGRVVDVRRVHDDATPLTQRVQFVSRDASTAASTLSAS